MADAVAAPLALPRPTPLGVVAGLALGPAVALGLGRFAYALLLPAMRDDLGWSYAQGGAINAANAAGYLLGALIVAPMAARWGDKRTFWCGLLITALALSASGAVADFLVLSLLRLIAGAAGALALVAGGALAAAAGGGGSRARPARALALYFAGAGFGMVVSAAAVPALITIGGWRAGWLVLGALGLVAAALALPALARTPEVARLGATVPGRRAWRVGPLLPVLVSYVLFGAGYIAYATFIVAYLQNRMGFAPHDVMLFWGCVGVAASGAGFVWAPLLSRLRGGRAIALANAATMLGAVLPVLSRSGFVAYVSAVVFGGAFLIVPTAVTAFVRKAVPASGWTAAIAVLTVGFALGQCFGPMVSGVVSDGRYGVGGGLLLSGGVLAAAALTALMQREPRTPRFTA